MTPRQLLLDEKIEAIAIASPDYRHASETIAALKSGKHVFCEKPMSERLSSALAMSREARRVDRRLAIGFHLRMRPSMRRAREILKDGIIGRVNLIELDWSIGGPGQTALPPLPAHRAWREDPRLTAGGALAARGSHLIDLVRFLTGQEVGLVSAQASFSHDGIDLSFSSIMDVGGTTAIVHSSKTEPYPDNTVTLHGDLGRITLTDALDPSSEETLTLRTTDGDQTEAFRADDPYRLEIDSFAAMIRDEDTDLATAADGLASMAVMEAIKRAYGTGRSAIPRRYTV